MNTAQPRILIVRVGAMGDVIHAMPAVAMLRETLPDAYIGWAIEPRWAPLLRVEGATKRDANLMPLVDAVHLVNAKQWNEGPFSVATARSIAALRRELRAARYDIAIDLQGTVRSAVITRMSGAKRIVGSAAPREHIARLLYRTRVPMTQAHVIDQAEEMTRAALLLVTRSRPFISENNEGDISTAAGQLDHSAERRSPHLLLPRDPAAEAWWQHRRAAMYGERRSVLLAATAGWGAKEWPSTRFAELAIALAEEDQNVLLNTALNTFDPITIRATLLAQELRPGIARHIFPLPATLPQLIAATREMGCVIAGDTGPLHLAEALGIPTVGLFGPTDPARTGPRFRSICLRDPDSVTDHRRHAQTEAGLARISVAQVLEAFHAVVRNA